MDYNDQSSMVRGIYNIFKRDPNATLRSIPWVVKDFIRIQRLDWETLRQEWYEFENMNQPKSFDPHPDVLRRLREYQTDPDKMTQILEVMEQVLERQDTVRTRESSTPSWNQPEIIPRQLPPDKTGPTGITKTSLSPAAKRNICIQFIGGPYNGEQRIHSADDPTIRQGGIFGINEPGETVIDDNDIITQTEGTVWRYKLTFIPLNETTFSDEQIVIGIFQ